MWCLCLVQRSNITAFCHFGHIHIYGNLFQHTFCHITYILPYKIYMVNVPHLPYIPPVHGLRQSSRQSSYQSGCGGGIQTCTCTSLNCLCQAVKSEFTKFHMKLALLYPWASTSSPPKRQIYGRKPYIWWRRRIFSFHHIGKAHHIVYGRIYGRKIRHYIW